MTEAPMAVILRPSSALTRRRFLKTSTAAAGLAIAAPAISHAADRPLITHGIQSGDVSVESGVVWARSDRPARMLAEIATTDSFKEIAHAVYVDALPETDFTAKALIDGLPAGQDIFYRLRFQDLASPTIVGEPMVGRFRTAPADRRSVSFLWSGDTAGQGWGIDESRGGMRTYATMLRNRPDFFIHSGDNIYADGPILAEQKMPNGETWKNLVTEDKAKSAETLAEFRGNYKYNLLDANVRAFNAEVPIFSQWDDHEVTNNWWPGEPLTRPEWRGHGGSLRAERLFSRPPTGRLAQARAVEFPGDMEGDCGRHADRLARRLRRRSQLGRRGRGPGRRRSAARTRARNRR